MCQLACFDGTIYLQFLENVLAMAVHGVDADAEIV